MATIMFTEGKNELLNNGLPATCYFLLSTKPCSGTGTHVAADTLVGGVGEITGTGYSRQSQAEPSASAGTVQFAGMTWNTASAVDWPAAVKSVVLVTTSGNSGKAICAWDLGATRDMSGPNTTETFTPALGL